MPKHVKRLILGYSALSIGLTTFCLIGLPVGANKGSEALAAEPVVSSYRLPETERALCGLDSVVCPEEPASVVRAHTITAYTSDPAETDDTPCISANGSDICALFAQGKNTCASNAYPFGTKLSFLGKECVVRDRMNKRYPDRVDFYFGYDKVAAWSFGTKKNVLVTTNN